MISQSTLNAGVIGLGVGHHHAQAYHDHPRANLRSVCDFDKQKLLSLCQEYEGVATYQDGRQILTDKEVDIVSIASYDAFHAQQIIEALNHGKHVIAEKPMCMSLAELNEVKHALGQNPGLKLSANHVLRTNSRFNRFRKDLHEKKFGDVYFLEADYLWGRKHKLSGWRGEMPDYSIILGAAIHMIDLVIWLLGARPVEVQAMANRVVTQKDGFRGESFAVILLRFEDGVIAKLTGHAGCVHPHYHELKIYGSELTAVHDYHGARYYYSEDPNHPAISVSEPYPEKDARPAVIHSFIDSIGNPEISPLVSEEDVFSVMSTCFASEEALTTKQAVQIEYLTP